MSRHVQTGTPIQTFPSFRNTHIGEAFLDDYIFMLFNQMFSDDQLLDLRQRSQLALRRRVVRLDTSLRDRIEKVRHLLFVLRNAWPEKFVLLPLPEHVASLDRVLNLPSLQTLDLVVYVAHKTTYKVS